MKVVRVDTRGRIVRRRNRGLARVRRFLTLLLDYIEAAWWDSKWER